MTDKGTPSATAHVGQWVNQAAKRRLFPPNACDRKVEQNCCSRPTAAYTPTRERALQSALATVNLLAVNTSVRKQIHLGIITVATSVGKQHRKVQLNT